METSRLTGDGTAETVSRDQIAGANGDRKILIFSVQLTTVDHRLIHTLAICDDHTYLCISAIIFRHNIASPITGGCSEGLGSRCVLIFLLITGTLV